MTLLSCALGEDGEEGAGEVLTELLPKRRRTGRRGERGSGELGERRGEPKTGGGHWWPELRAELSNRRIETVERESSIGCSSLEDIGGQDRVTTRPGHLLALVFHTAVLEPNLAICLD